MLSQRRSRKTYTFGRSQIDGTDVRSLVKNRMVGTARAPGRETVPRPRDNEVVIFRDLLYSGLRFPLHPAVVDILWYFDIYLHQLTPNAILRLLVYMWICRTTKIKPSAKGFASAHQVHHQRQTVFEEEGDQSVEKRLPIWLSEFLLQVRRGEPCDRLPQQVAFGLATTLALPLSDSSLPRRVSPLATKELPLLHESYAKNPSCPEGDEFVMMLRRFARKYSTRDIVEEYRSIPVCPLVDG
jgi:hypothetical protein